MNNNKNYSNNNNLQIKSSLNIGFFALENKIKFLNRKSLP